jgi:S-adenosylmethionine decarboxylase proenzyme
MKTFGITILAELYGCPFDILDDIVAVEAFMLAACEKANMHSIGVQSKKFDPQGLSCILFLEESHMSIHTWPEFNFACLDVFTCGTSAYPEQAVEFLARKLNSNKHSLRVIDRKNDEVG